MNGRGLRLYGLSSFTRPVSYPCHRRSRPLRGGVTRGETGWEESAVVSFTPHVLHSPLRARHDKETDMKTGPTSVSMSFATRIILLTLLSPLTRLVRIGEECSVAKG